MNPLPSDFNPIMYHLLYQDVATLSTKELEEHYQWVGSHEGRVYQFPSSPVSIPIETCPERTTVVCLHVGNLAVFYEMWQRYTGFFLRPDLDWFISVHDAQLVPILQQCLPHAILNLVPNKGRDIGGLLKNLSLIRDRGHDYSLFYILHTKSNTTWRHGLMDPLLLRNLPPLSETEPQIEGAHDFIGLNFKDINRPFTMDILLRTPSLLSFPCNHLTDRFIGNLHYDQLSRHSLDINNKFMDYYHSVSKQGRHDHFLVSNPNLITRFGQGSYFIMGTIMRWNGAFFRRVFQDMDLHREWELLEEGDFQNNVPRRTHAWEYFLGMVCHAVGGKILPPKTFPPRDPLLRPQSLIHLPLSRSRIAVFLHYHHLEHPPLRSFLASLSIPIDLYFGDGVHDQQTRHGLSLVEPGIEHIRSLTIPPLNLFKFNFYLGLTLQRSYQCLLVFSHETAEASSSQSHRLSLGCVMVVTSLWKHSSLPHPLVSLSPSQTLDYLSKHFLVPSPTK